MNNPGLKNVYQQSLRDVLSNVCLTAAGLVIGSSAAAKVKIANTVTFTVDGVFKSKTTAEVAFSDVTPQAASTFRKYLVSLQADGTPTITNGVAAASAALALLPDCPDDEVTIGYCQIATAAGYTFVPGTTLLSATGITDTFADLMYHTGN